jgi:hypothetical protein
VVAGDGGEQLGLGLQRELVEPRLGQMAVAVVELVVAAAAVVVVAIMHTSPVSTIVAG